MMQGQNIICFANDWDADPTSKHQVMKILARSNRVLWVNSIGLRRPRATAHDASRIANKVRQFIRGPVAITGNLHVLTPLAIAFHGVPGVRTANAWLVSRYVRAQARKLGMDRFQLWTFIPTTAPLVQHLRPEKVVYYCVDEWSAFSFLDAALMRELEAQLIAQSDLVLVSAEALYASKRPLHSRTYLVPHGVDSEHFAQARNETTVVARELHGLPRPIVGFWGLIHEWIDLDLIEHAARRHPRWSFVLVGKAAVKCRELQRLPNVHLVGQRPYEVLPSFAKGFTAAMLPFKVNRLTENVNPIKLREYLAAGLPVVTTPLPEVRPYASVVRVGATQEEFADALEQAVRDTSEASARQRMEVVCKETWLTRVEHISALVESVPARDGRRSVG